MTVPFQSRRIADIRYWGATFLALSLFGMAIGVFQGYHAPHGAALFNGDGPVLVGGLAAGNRRG